MTCHPTQREEVTQMRSLITVALIALALAVGAEPALAKKKHHRCRGLSICQVKKPLRQFERSVRHHPAESLFMVGAAAVTAAAFPLESITIGIGVPPVAP